MSEIKFDDFFIINEWQRNFAKICSLKESIFWFIFSLQLKNNTQEAILRVCGDQNFGNSRYEKAIVMFMTQHPNRDVRKSQRHPAGCVPHKRPKRKKSVVPESVLISDSDSSNSLADEVILNLSDISSDSDIWTSSDEDKDD